MYTLHIENTVDDFTAWKAAFDKFERLRAERGVESYRVSRSVSEPDHVYVDLVFVDLEQAQQFVPVLEKIWSTPQSRAVSRSHTLPQIREIVQDAVVAGVIAR